MSTNGSVSIVHDGKTLASYNHSDSYPSYLGVKVLEFARTVDGDINSFRDLTRALRVVEELETAPEEDRVKYAHLSQQVSSGTDWYAVLRSQQGDLGEMLKNGIMCGGTKPAWNYYGYRVNLDDATFSVLHNGRKVSRLTWDLSALPSNEEFLAAQPED